MERTAGSGKILAAGGRFRNNSTCNAEDQVNPPFAASDDKTS
jgi:hypothetical protein